MAKTGSGRVSGMIEVPAPELPSNVVWEDFEMSDDIPEGVEVEDCAAALTRSALDHALKLMKEHEVGDVFHSLVAAQGQAVKATELAKARCMDFTVDPYMNPCEWLVECKCFEGTALVKVITCENPGC